MFEDKRNQIIECANCDTIYQRDENGEYTVKSAVESSETSKPPTEQKSSEELSDEPIEKTNDVIARLMLHGWIM